MDQQKKDIEYARRRQQFPDCGAEKGRSDTSNTKGSDEKVRVNNNHAFEERSNPLSSKGN